MTVSADWTRVPDLPWAFGGPPLQGRLRAGPEDFQVDEILDLQPGGAGEHVLVQIRKTGENTEYVARELARHAGRRPVDVGYSGLKDRNAITTQWFSVCLAGAPEPDWGALDSERVQVIARARHGRKLKRGTAWGNRFRIRLRQVQGDRASAEHRLTALGRQGAPNYFGEQRFGRDYGNLARATRLFEGGLRRLKPHQRGLYLSAARSQLFNEILAQRVLRGDWHRALAGDVMQLDGSRAWFAAPEADAETEQRVLRGDIHPTGPLWGAGALPSSGAVEQMEASLVERLPVWCAGLERFGLKQERRALRMPVLGLQWSWEGDVLELAFELPRGCFATAVLRELVREDREPGPGDKGGN